MQYITIMFDESDKKVRIKIEKKYFIRFFNKYENLQYDIVCCGFSYDLKDSKQARRVMCKEDRHPDAPLRKLKTTNKRNR